MLKSKCHNCKFKRNVSGNSNEQVSCGNPIFTKLRNESFFDMLSGVKGSPNLIALKALGLQLTQDSSECSFPMNFKPNEVMGDCKGYDSDGVQVKNLGSVKKIK